MEIGDGDRMKKARVVCVSCPVAPLYMIIRVLRAGRRGTWHGSQAVVWAPASGGLSKIRAVLAFRPSIERQNVGLLQRYQGFYSVRGAMGFRLF